MGRFLYLLILLLPLSLMGQTPVGSWSDHLVYTSAKSVATARDEVFASTGSSILVYNKTISELRKLSTVNGLSETGISSIAYSEVNSTLIIAYTSTNIDLVSNNTVYNIPDILNKYIPGKKQINRIRVNNTKYAYAACSFGIVVIDIVKREIHDTWHPAEGKEVYDLAFGNGKIYAATSGGVWTGTLSDPGLSYYGNWSPLPGIPDQYANYNLIALSGNRIVTNLHDQNAGDDFIYSVNSDGSGNSLILSEAGIQYNSIEPTESGFIVSSPRAIRLYNSNGILIVNTTGYGGKQSNISQAAYENGDLWIADISSGLVMAGNMEAFSILTLPGPASENSFSVESYNGKTVVTGGGMNSGLNPFNRPFEVSVHEDGSWKTLESSNTVDAIRALIDPRNQNHIFVTSWKGGLSEYRDNQLVKQFDGSNSPLQSSNGAGIFGMAMDADGNLWITQSGASGSIKILKPDGTWAVDPLTISAPVIGDIIIAENGYKWMILPGGQGLFVMDDNKTPFNFTDDRSKKFPVTDNNRKTIYNVLSIASDHDGNIWVGTDQGPLIYFNPEKVFDTDFFASRIKIPRNDGTDLADYLLGTETITCIAVDGANRKWIGTASSGAYLISADGTEKLRSYNTENSPLYSNHINSISADGKTGDIWIGTSAGLISVRENATNGKESFSGVYAFPNPVRHEYMGNVTVTGLVSGSDIRITDVSGNLVYETESDGGMATWDLTNYRGQRVATGVYIVFCASPDGKQGAVTKILVIN